MGQTTKKQDRLKTRQRIVSFVIAIILIIVLTIGLIAPFTIPYSGIETNYEVAHEAGSFLRSA